MVRVSGVVGSALTILAFAGSGSCSKAPTSPTTPAAPTTIRITATGVSPKSVQVALGARVLFINNDTRDHEMTSDPHPEHTDCPVINQVGLLKPGEQRETGNLVTAQTCGFHGHETPFDVSLQGSIIAK